MARWEYHAGQLRLWEMEGLFVILAGIVTVLLVGRRPYKKLKAEEKRVHKLIQQCDPRLRMSALDIARGIRNGKFTCIEIVSMYIEQIKKVNPFLNAVVGERFQEALEEAKRVDERIAAKDTPFPPLLGVPLISKEVHEYPGLPYTSGIVGRKHCIGKRKCPALQRIEQAGAIVLGCGNVSEGCMWSEASNTVFGTTSNPYALDRTSGGSSGGNAAIVSALGACFTITSDVGGSTRIPAMYNGLFGHKPSGGAIPNSRSIPTVNGLAERYCQLGPCTRYARDLFPVLELLSGPLEDHEVGDASDDEREYHETQKSYMRRYEWPNPGSVDTKRLRYYVVWDQPSAVMGITSRRHTSMIKAQKQVVDALKARLQVTIESISFPEFSKSFDIWSAMLQEATAARPFAEVISEGKFGIYPIYEMLKWLATWGKASDHTLPALGLAVAETFARFTPKRNAEMTQLGHEFREKLNKLLGENGVLIFPSLPNPAPAHGPLPNLLFFADFAACGIFNTLELPATSVPVGLNEEGLPVGVQLVAGIGHDHLALAVATQLEQFGVAKWVPPRVD